MRLGTLTTLAAIAMTALAIPAAHAGDWGDESCSCKGNLCLGTVTIGSGRADDPAPTLYVDDRNYVFGNGIWIYHESNGHDGLQRGGGSPWLPDDWELCVDDPNVQPDTLLL